MSHLPLSPDGQKVLALHYRAVKAAQAYEAATPGTQTKRRLRDIWEKAEAKFEDALQ